MPAEAAPAGSLCDIAGLKVGHYTDSRRPTGCTVVLCEQGGHGVTASVDVRGAAPGTRETDLLAPENSVERIHALLLTGGSAFGLDAAGGVMRWLAERGHGLTVGPVARVPIVPAAVLFDLYTGDPAIHPDAAAGYAACEAASANAPMEGSVGAGTGATVGKLFGLAGAKKGGVGNASVTVNGVTVAALVVVNAVGDVIDPANGQLVAGVGAIQHLLTGAKPWAPLGAATTLGVVATDALLSKTQCKKLAQMSHAGLARTINPVHTPVDGDVMFALATGAVEQPADLTFIGILAAEVTARAVLRAVRAAATIGP